MGFFADDALVDSILDLLRAGELGTDSGKGISFLYEKLRLKIAIVSMLINVDSFFLQM